MISMKDIKRQLPKYYKEDSFLNSLFHSSVIQFNSIEETIKLYRNITSIINCPNALLFLLEKEEGLTEVGVGVIKYLSNPLDDLKFEGNVNIAYDEDTILSYIDYTFKRRERLMAKNFIKYNTFNNANFRKMSAILGMNYVSLKWDKESGIVDVLVSRDEEIDVINSAFIIQMITLWIPFHLKFGTIYSTLLGQVVSDFKYSELESKIYRNVEELIYTREIKEVEKGGVTKWRQYLQNS
ncbi:MAG: hypothetical protein ACRCZ0_12385 [Cetobacterium sp.]